MAIIYLGTDGIMCWQDGQTDRHWWLQYPTGPKGRGDKRVWLNKNQALKILYNKDYYIPTFIKIYPS